MADKLTREQIDNCRKLFNLFDVNHDQTISSEELGAVIRALGVNPSKREMDALIKRVDVDCSGRIEFGEFLKLYAERVNSEITREDVARYFLMFDRDGSGTIDAKEFRRVITTLGEPLTEEEADMILEDADKDGDGLIDYHEFSDMLIKKVI
jgi:calmodulin